MSDAIEVITDEQFAEFRDASDEHPGDCTCGGCACSMCGSNAVTCDGQCQQSNPEAQQESAAPVSGAPST